MIMQEYLVVDMNKLTAQKRVEKEGWEIPQGSKEASTITEQEWACMFARAAIWLRDHREKLESAIVATKNKGVLQVSEEQIGEIDYQVKLLETVRENLYRAFAEHKQPRRKINVPDSLAAEASRNALEAYRTAQEKKEEGKKE